MHAHQQHPIARNPVRERIAEWLIARAMGIHLGDGTVISSLRLGDGTGVSEVRKGDGTVLFSAIPASGVSRWEFEQDFTDSWGTNDGANNGATFTTTAEVGTYAAAFDGASYVDFGAFGDGLDEFSVGAWIRPDALAVDMPILMRDGGGIRNDRHWALRIDDASGTIGMVAFDASNNQITAMSSGTVSTGSLVHVAGTVGGTTATVYISGSADGSDSNASYGAQPTSAETVKAGGDNVGGYDFYDGIIDDPRFYNKELTATEVSNWQSTGSISG